jgi:hypothetical protein
MPLGIYDNIECDVGGHPPFTPQEHQKATLDYFMRSKYKGLLLLHRLGSGKSCTSIMVADEFLGVGSILMSEQVTNAKKVFVMTPGSLRQNFIEEYCERCGVNPKTLRTKYTFITYNYMVGERIPDMTDGLVIIDEVHNFINGVKNQSKHISLIYNSLMKTKCRILALTGTLGNQIWEWPLLGNLLKPGTFPNIVENGRLDRVSFTKQFKFNRDGTIKARDPKMLAVELRGIISYFPGRGGAFYPKVIYEPPIRVRTTVPQDNEYWGISEWETSIRNKGPPSKTLIRTDAAKYKKEMEEFIMASKYIMTRYMSNFFYPKDIRSNKKPSTRDDVVHTGTIKRYVYTGEVPNVGGIDTGEISTSMTFFVDKIMKNMTQKASLDRGMTLKELRADMGEDVWKKLLHKVRKHAMKDVRRNVTRKIETVNIGWVTGGALSQPGVSLLSDVYSRKFTAVILNIVNNWNAKHMVFSFFKTKAGVNLLHALLSHCGIRSVIYSGDISDKRRRSILKEFNAENNRHGDKIKAILVTDAGAEGINLLETQHVHVLESSRGLKVQQAIGRVVRYRSHMVEGRRPMKDNEKVVHVWRYWTVSGPEPFIIPKDPENHKSIEKIITNKMMVDEVLYRKSVVQRNTMDGFAEYIKRASMTPYTEDPNALSGNIDYGFSPVSDSTLEACKISDSRYKNNYVLGKSFDVKKSTDMLIDEVTGISDEGESE